MTRPKNVAVNSPVRRRRYHYALRCRLKGWLGTSQPLLSRVYKEALPSVVLGIFFLLLHTYLVGAPPLKNGGCYGGVTALHIAVDVAIECPSGLSSALFLALIFSSIVFAWSKALEKRFGTYEGRLLTCPCLLMGLVERRGYVKFGYMDR